MHKKNKKNRNNKIKKFSRDSWVDQWAPMIGLSGHQQDKTGLSLYQVEINKELNLLLPNNKVQEVVLLPPLLPHMTGVNGLIKISWRWVKNTKKWEWNFKRIKQRNRVHKSKLMLLLHLRLYLISNFLKEEWFLLYNLVISLLSLCLM